MGRRRLRENFKPARRIGGGVGRWRVENAPPREKTRATRPLDARRPRGAPITPRAATSCLAVAANATPSSQRAAPQEQSKIECIEETTGGRLGRVNSFNAPSSSRYFCCFSASSSSRVGLGLRAGAPRRFGGTGFGGPFLGPNIERRTDASAGALPVCCRVGNQLCSTSAPPHNDSFRVGFFDRDANIHILLVLSDCCILYIQSGRTG